MFYRHNELLPWNCTKEFEKKVNIQNNYNGLLSRHSAIMCWISPMCHDHDFYAWSVSRKSNNSNSNRIIVGEYSIIIEKE